MHDLLQFLRFISAFKQVYRNAVVGTKGSTSIRLENDAEHSFELAMAAWYLINSCNLPLDTSKCVFYALVHDLVEGYTGDFDSFETASSKHIQKRKSDAEKEAIIKIREDFKEFPELYATIMQYERKDTEEALFVYSLDKLIADLNQEFIAGVSFADFGITKQMLEERFENKIYKSKYLKNIATKSFDMIITNCIFSPNAAIQDFRKIGLDVLKA